MFAEYITYLTAFVATSGIAVISILISYQLFQTNKKPEFQLLLYQQIFLFSFLIYSIWGNLALRQIIADVNMSAEIAGKLAFFIPLLGIPFLMVSWFMLIKFSLNINQYSFAKPWMYIYFTGFLTVLSSAVFLFHTGLLETPSNPDKFLIRLFVSLNLLFHLLFILPFFKPNVRKPEHYKKQKMNKCLLIYLNGIVLHSLALWFAVSFGFIYTAVSFLLVFSASSVFPLCIKYFAALPEKKPAPVSDSFASFCSKYQISKRESEIILEICDGKTNKAIAEKLFITLQTVKDHTHRIYTKTNVKSRVQLANLVRERTEKI